MRALGIRTSASEIRYAVVDNDGSQPMLINATTENRLKFPAGCTRVPQKLKWWEGELEAIISKYAGVEAIAVKVNEFTARRDNTSARLGAYLDAVAFLFASRSGIEAKDLLYAQMKTNSGKVMDLAAEIGKTATYWNPSAADAIVAATFATMQAEVK